MPIDLRLPKKSKKELKEGMTGPMLEEPAYPYGTRLELQEDTIKKNPNLMKADVKDTVTIVAEATVVEKRAPERLTADGTVKQDRSIEYQLTYLDVEPESNRAASQSFDEATKG